jgi:hypothetical protein
MVVKMVFHVPFNHLMLLPDPENCIETVSAVTTKKSEFLLSLIVLLIYIYVEGKNVFIYCKECNFS